MSEFWDKVGTEPTAQHRVWRCNHDFGDDVCNNLLTDDPQLQTGFVCGDCLEERLVLCGCGDRTGDDMHCNAHAVSHGMCQYITAARLYHRSNS